MAKGDDEFDELSERVGMPLMPLKGDAFGGLCGARDGIAGGDFGEVTGLWRFASSLKGSAGSQAGPSCTGFALCTSIFNC